MIMSRVYNFSAGPAVLPEEVLKEAADEMLDYQGSGMSVMEMSHRSKVFQQIADEAEQDEGHPVVDGGDVALKGGAQEVAQARHQGLEAAEPGADDEVMPTSQLPGGKTLADGDGEGVHGEAHGDEKEFQNAHS